MNQQIKQIAERLRGLRDAMGVKEDDIAVVCSISVDEYKSIESGECDIPVSILQTISQHYGIELSVLMFGNEAYMNSYFLTRAGSGASVERRKAYKYQALAAGFKNRDFTPFEVTVEYNADKEMTLSSHVGQEFNFILEGKMLLNLNGKELVLNEGDSIYFDSSLPHEMKALDGKTVKFLAVII